MALIRARGGRLGPAYLLGRAALFGGGRAIPLIEPGAVLAPLSLARAQTGALSTALGADGATWVEYGADVPRFSGAARRLLVGGQRTNAVRNPRAEGAVAGAPGTLPTNWSVSLPAGVSVEVVGPAVRNGIPGVDLRFFSASAAGGSIVVDPETPTGIAAAPSQQWTASVFAQLVAGSLAGITSFGVGATSRTAGGSALTGNSTSADTLSATFARFVRAVTASADVTTGAIQPRIVATVTAGAALDTTVFLGGAQMEAGSNASSLILPPVGTPGASTRGADLISAPLASLGIGGNGACTILMSCVLPHSTPLLPGAFGFFCIDDGTSLTRFAARTNIINGIIGERLLAGAGVGTPTSFTYTPNVPIRLGATIVGDGTMRLSVAGGTVVGLSGGATSGLTTFRVGINAPGGVSLFGETNTFRVLPYALSDGGLQAAVEALPA